MPSSSPPAPVERARPLLGTVVAVRVTHADQPFAHAAIDAAFGEIAEVHRLMSFHEPESDLSRLNRLGSEEPVRLDPRVAEVLSFALELASRSEGVFDPTVGVSAVASGRLPVPLGAPRPDPAGSWKDVIQEGLTARLSRPVWLDLGGVAKGYAVDRAMRRLRGLGVRRACVNAGGDLRVVGNRPELVRLGAGASNELPLVEIANGALASSGGDRSGRATAGHIDGATGRPVPRERFASVAAPTCMVADALTKAVLARGDAAAPLLAHYGAHAWTFDREGGWRCAGAS